MNKNLKQFILVSLIVIPTLVLLSNLMNQNEEVVPITIRSTDYKAQSLKSYQAPKKYRDNKDNKDHKENEENPRK